VSDDKHESDGPPSLRKFDYFGERAPAAPDVVASAGDATEEMQDQAAAIVRQRRAHLRHSIAGAAFSLAVIYFLWGYRDLISYAFQEPRPPQQLGDIVGMQPGDIPHNSFVEITGITEHRGMTQKLVRGFGLERQEYWYYRLVGSRGVFVEVPPEPEKYGRAVQLTVSGRAVDPVRAEVYEALLSNYHERFHTRERLEHRIIQVGVKPGDGRAPFLASFALLLFVAAFNVWTLSRYLAARRRSSAGFGR
jgi:hypothetical protein